MDKKIDVIVVGSANTDMVIQTKQMPKPGETVLGGKFFMNPGGKGANQAVASARLGGKVSFIGRVGKDVFGDQTIAGLNKEGINVDHLKQDPETPSGIATITVDQSGQNSIVVAPGANAKLSPKDIEDAQKSFKSSEVILIQLEINLDTVLYTAKLGHFFNKKVILNPAPYNPLPEEIYPYLYMITPNEIEAEALTGVKINNEEQAEEAAIILRKRGVKSVIITMGAAGAFVVTEEFSGLVPGKEVEAIDTTAAGDIFNGALAVAIAEKKLIEEAVIFANRAAAFSVTKMGAQLSCPTLDDMAQDNNKVAIMKSRSFLS